jgi:peptidoglycan/xylan/chitin deacetylase (PgdA/CDA1 family)
MRVMNVGAARRIARAAAKAALVRATIARSAVAREPRDGLAILYWHRVGEGVDVFAVTPRAFRRACDEIERSRCRVIDLAEIDDLTLAPGERAVALTFDDGYADLLEHAVPELERRGWPATVFVVPGVVAGAYRFTDIYRQDPGFITYDQMRDVERRTRVRFESHSLSHRDLPPLPDDEARREIAGSAEALAAELGRPLRLFCYPRGYFGAREEAMCAGAGYVAAVGTEYGVNRPPWDRYALRRTIFDGFDDRFVMRARITGLVDRPPAGRSARQARGFTNP